MFPASQQLARLSLRRPQLPFKALVLLRKSTNTSALAPNRMLARLIGVEYIISENLFLTLADVEKPLWHTHEYEIDRGDNLPLGLLQMMMSLTRDGQLYDELAYGLKTSLREDDCVPIDSVPRFFNKLTISGAS
ncbi:hypothetical protein Peur_059051 [Populus x canadensis]|uniref:Uncharacterized protein n=1 Tax=Populus deltoides TaxID=3696 RepID=A0A8T2X9X3_POPDE|nr:hypothetical protein H0E87_024879 [Populus deltoides]